MRSARVAVGGAARGAFGTEPCLPRPAARALFPRAGCTCSRRGPGRWTSSRNGRSASGPPGRRSGTASGRGVGNDVAGSTAEQARGVEGSACGTGARQGTRARRTAQGCGARPDPPLCGRSPSCGAGPRTRPPVRPCCCPRRPASPSRGHAVLRENGRGPSSSVHYCKRFLRRRPPRGRGPRAERTPGGSSEARRGPAGSQRPPCTPVAHCRSLPVFPALA